MKLLRRILCLFALLLAFGPGTPAFGQDGLAPLLQQADEDDWNTRWFAARRLAKVTGEDVFKLRGLMRTHKSANIRSAIAWACWFNPDLGSALILGIVLKRDRDPAVRRACARALVHHRDRRAVAALVRALQTETDRRTKLHIVQTLHALTTAPCLLDAGAWTAWWNKHKGDPRFRPADEPPSKAEYEGIVLETRTVAALPSKGKKNKNRRPHFLVLPQFGWKPEAFGPYLLPLREHAAISWVQLPTVQRLTGRSGFHDDIPAYPVARLVRSLDRFREKLGVERFVILADGASGWIAMRYALFRPKRVAALILIDTALDKQAYATSLQRAAARGNRAERFAANTLMGRNSAKLSPATLDKLHRGGVGRGALEASDLEVAWLFHKGREPQGFASVPDISWSRHRTLDVPSLFMYSAASAFSGHREAGRIGRHFPRSLVAPIAEAAGMPYMEHNQKFTEVVTAFLRRYALIENPPKPDSR